MSRSPLRREFLLIVIGLMLAYFPLLPAVQAVSPAPDGGYPGNNTAEGDSALQDLNSGTDNTAIGFGALFGDTTGNRNTATGSSALADNQNASDNTATGFQALVLDTTGSSNTANGSRALQSNTSGSSNTATGADTLTRNNGGADNTGTGANALANNTNGSENTATGFQALAFNASGGDNTATGLDALFSNTSGGDNTANGVGALYSNSSGSFNTAGGVNALRNNKGSSNTAVGIQSLNNNSSGSSNVAIGALAGQNLTTGNNNIDIGTNVLGNAGEANTIRIGKSGTQQKAFVAGIYGKTVASGVGVIINASGQLGTVQSSARYKDDIKPMDKASEAILKLKPVTFHYKEGLDPEKIPQFGLIAEEVEKVNPDLVVRDQDGKVSTVRYEAVNAMLLNEFLKAHRKLDQQQAMIDRQQKQIEALTATVQKVSDQVALSKPAPQLVANP